MNKKTLDSLKGTWVGDLLEVPEEEIKNETDGLLEISEHKSKKKTETTEDGKEITFPHLLGEMSQYEKALLVLWKRKNSQHEEICKKEHAKGFEGDFSPEHEELHRVLSILRDEMWNSIQGRFPDAPGDSKTISKGGQIFATKKEKPSMEEMVETLFGGAFPFRGVMVGIGHS